MQYYCSVCILTKRNKSIKSELFLFQSRNYWTSPNRLIDKKYTGVIQSVRSDGYKKENLAN